MCFIKIFRAGGNVSRADVSEIGRHGGLPALIRKCSKGIIEMTDTFNYRSENPWNFINYTFGSSTYF